jgi:hypothetical protein
VKKPNFMVGKFTVAQSDFGQTLSLIFRNIFLGQKLLIFLAVAYVLHGPVPRKKGGIQMLASLAPSNQTVGPLLITPGWQS